MTCPHEATYALFCQWAGNI